MGWRTKIRWAKKEHRPELSDWEEDGLFEAFPAYVNALSEDYESFIPGNEHNSPMLPEELPAQLDAKTLTYQEFSARYEATCTPVVIHNIPHGYDGGKKTEEWPALKKWRFFTMENDQVLRNRRFKCGEDDDGHPIKLKMKHFLKYLQNNHDDSPLYIFDSGFDDDRLANRILKDYKVPSYFKDDLFKLVSEKRRPPYRWFLVGPERSGTSVHVDPLGTSAWNTLIHGQKRWVLFPPHVPKHVVKARDLVRPDEDDEPIHYFMYILPRIKRKAAASCFCSSSAQQPTNVPDDYKNFACYEFTQNPGETVFIPNGWWHAVLNLSNTVGITQNFCSPRNFDDVWLSTRSGRKKLAWKWLCALEERMPRLADRARELNERDRFVMKYDPIVMEELKKAEEERSEQKRQWHKRGEKGHPHDRPGKIYGEDAPQFLQTTTRLSYLDRDWKRSRSSRPVSPP